MDEVINQAPTNLKYEEILPIYIKNSSNIVETLTELWNIKKEEKKISIKDNKWNEIRELCDTYDSEIYKQLKGK